MGLMKAIHELNDIYQNIEDYSTTCMIKGVRTEFGLLSFESAYQARSIKTLEVLNANGVHSYIKKDPSNGSTIFFHDSSFVQVMRNVQAVVDDMTSGDIEVLQETRKGEVIVEKRAQLNSLVEYFETIPMDLKRIRNKTDADKHYLSNIWKRAQLKKYQEVLDHMIDLYPELYESEIEINTFALNLIIYIKNI